MILVKVKRPKNVWERMTQDERYQNIKILIGAKDPYLPQIARIENGFIKHLIFRQKRRQIENALDKNIDIIETIINTDKTSIPIINLNTVKKRNTFINVKKIGYDAQKKRRVVLSGKIPLIALGLQKNNYAKQNTDLNVSDYKIFNIGDDFETNCMSIYKWNHLEIKKTPTIPFFKDFIHPKRIMEPNFVPINTIDKFDETVEFDLEKYELSSFNTDLYLLVKKILKIDVFSNASHYDNIIAIKIIMKSINGMRSELTEIIPSRSLELIYDDIDILLYLSWLLSKTMTDDLMINTKFEFYKNIEVMSNVLDTKLYYIYYVFRKVYPDEMRRIENYFSETKIIRMILLLYKRQIKEKQKINIMKYNYFIIHKNVNFLSYIKYEVAHKSIHKKTYKSITKKIRSIQIQNIDPTSDKFTQNKKIQRYIVERPKMAQKYNISKYNISNLYKKLIKFHDIKKIDSMNLSTFPKLMKYDDKNNYFKSYFLKSSLDEWVTFQGNAAKSKDLFEILAKFITDTKTSQRVYAFLIKRINILHKKI